MIPTPAQIAAAKCNFFKEVAYYNDCKRYNTECCKNKLLDAFYLMKLAESGCNLLYDVICQLDSLDNTVADCTQDPTCEEMVIWSVKKFDIGGDYKVTLENEYDYSNKFVYTVSDDSTVIEASANVFITNGYSELMDSYVVNGGCSLVNGVEVCGDQYKSKVFVSLEIRLIAGLVGGYIQSIRIWNALPGSGTAFGGSMQYQDVDISPGNIWPARPGGSAANPAHLYLDHPQLATAVKNQIENFVWSIDSSTIGWNNALNIELSTTVVNGRLKLVTACKHNPSFSWWGFRQPAFGSTSPFNLNDVRIYLPWGTYDSIYNETYEYGTPTHVYNAHAFTNDCGNTSNVVVQGYVTPNLNLQATDLNKIVLNDVLQAYSSKTFGSYNTHENLVTESIPSCFKTTLVPTVTSTYPWSVSWYNPSGAYVGSGSITLTNPVKGNYKAVLTLIGTGCTLEKIINI